MASAEKRGTSPYPWRARYIRPDGTKGSESGYRTERAALERAREIEADLRRGLIADPRAGQQLLRDWITEWRSAVADHGATAANRRYLIDRWLLPAWGSTPLGALNWFAIRTWADRHAREGVASARTIDDALSLLSTILTAATDAGRIAANPIYRRRRGGGGRGGGEPVWVQPEQAYTLHRRLRPPYGLMVLLAAWCGMRWGEMCALHRDNVLLLRRDPARHVIRIDPRLGALHEIGATGEPSRPPADVPRDAPEQTSRLYLGPPKPPNGAREIDVPPLLVPILGEHIATWPWPYLCVGPHGARRRPGATAAKRDAPRAATWLQRGNVTSRILRPAVDGRAAAGGGRGHPPTPEWEPIATGLTWHGLRHSHKTWLREDGIDDVLQRERLGHARSREIGEHYTHVTPVMRQRMLDALDARWARCAGQSDAGEEHVS
jgi:integrase